MKEFLWGVLFLALAISMIMMSCCQPPVDPIKNGEYSMNSPTITYLPMINKDSGGFQRVYFPSIPDEEIDVGQPKGDVPFYSQVDRRWRSILMDGACECYPSNTIGTCGCAVASVAMVFSFLGLDYTPKTLNECLGDAACPMKWEKAVTRCGNGQILLEKEVGFSWYRLNKLVGENGYVVILGLQKNHYENLHFVVVLSGHGYSPAKYKIHDPQYTWGEYTNLNTYTDDDWTPYKIVLYFYKIPVRYKPEAEMVLIGTRGRVGRRSNVAGA